MAANTVVFQPLHLGVRQEAFRVVAPFTAQGAALKENGRTDPRAVLCREALQVEN